MQNADTIFGDGGEPQATDPPVITTKPGWQTSQGQMTAIFGLVCLVLALFGINKTPQQFQGYLDAAEHLAEIAGPIIAAMVTLVTYTISRGKTTSNAINATALVQSTQIRANGDSTAAGFMGHPGSIIGNTLSTLPAIGGIIGGPKSEWKDPATYQQILHIAHEAGLPGLSQVDAVSQQIPVSQLLSGILGMFHSKKSQ